jgi:hypothetical protein
MAQLHKNKHKQACDNAQAAYLPAGSCAPADSHNHSKPHAQLLTDDGGDENDVCPSMSCLVSSMHAGIAAIASPTLADLRAPVARLVISLRHVAVN